MRSTEGPRPYIGLSVGRTLAPLSVTPGAEPDEVLLSGGAGPVLLRETGGERP